MNHKHNNKMEIKCLKCVSFKCTKCDVSNRNKTDLKYRRKILNKTKRASNGNIKNIIKITSWNKGNSDLKYKINIIKEVINEKKPEILTINELNLDLNEDPNIVNIKGYNFEVDNLYELRGIGRTGIWIDKKSKL